MKRVLIIEDNRDLALGLQANLEVQGYQVEVIHEGTGAVGHARAFGPDLIVLDLMLPGMDGYQVLKELRRTGDTTPVLVLSARAEEVDKVRGFGLGADDYVTKPFGLMELLARVEALLRRQDMGAGRAGPREEEVERFGEVVIDPAARTVLRGGSPVALTPKAFDLLVALVRKRGRVVSRLQLMQDVWGHRAAVESRTVDTHVAELRRKLEDDPASPRHILTVWKSGYRFQR
ncbi:MAG TPA: response regulator transcription factor [Longimicrobium sp.]